MQKIRSTEITPERLYLTRRRFIIGMGSVVAGSLLLSSCKPADGTDEFCRDAAAATSADEMGNNLTSCDDITHYNNFYEFSTSKQRVVDLAKGFRTSPWQLSVGGLVSKPRVYTMEDVLALFPQEERVYRLRCVEGWGMVVPWVGFPLASMLRAAGPSPEAAYVRFTTVLDPQQMPGQRTDILPWPYTEGLRLDEAMHGLTILATGLYGKALPPQEGAPIRLVVPWKYGFKSAKSLVRIDLVKEMPVSSWMQVAPNEYGFYANVNPDVPHPRWSQSSERRIGLTGRVPTLPFNGYADDVAALYTGMDLKKLF